MSFWFLLSPGWKAGPQGVDNVLTLRTTPQAAELRIALMAVSGAALVPSLRLHGLHGPFEGETVPRLIPNEAPDATVGRGGWQHWEMLFQGNTPGQANGKLTWWLNGLPAGDYTGLEFWGPDGPWIRDVAWDLTAPTTGTSSRQSVSLDEMYLSAPATPGDRIVVMNDRETDAADQPPGGTTILVDAYTGAEVNPCPNDLATGDRSVLPNFLEGGDHCPEDEIAVFSPDDAAILDGGDAATPGVGSGIWRDVAGERRVEPSRPPRRVEVVLWIAKEKDRRDREVERVALGEVDLASDLFNEHRAGIRFHVIDVKAVWDDSPESVAARDALGCESVNGEVACTCRPTLITSGFFVPAKVNAYYVPAVFDEPESPRLVGGLNCRYDHDQALLDPNIIFISVRSSSPTALAHELGHGLGLEHTVDGDGEWYPGKVPADNVMRDDKWLASASLLLGQAFRVNFDSRSLLRRNGLQTGPHRSCECELWAACTRGEFIVQSELGKRCPAVSRAWP